MNIKKKKFFVPDYDRLLDLINTKTKLLYLSSPNIVQVKILKIMMILKHS